MAWRPLAVVAIAAAILLLAPLGTAAAGDGTVETAKATTFSGDVTASGATAAALWLTGAATHIAVRAPHLRMTVWESSKVTVDPIRYETKIEHRDYDLWNVTLESASGTDGFLGYSGVVRAPAVLAGGSDIYAEPSATETLSTSPAAITERANDSTLGFYASVPGAHLRVRTDGLASVPLQGRIKLFGPALNLHSDAGESSVDTGYFSTGPVTGVERWVILAMDSGSFSLSAPRNGYATFTSMDVHWNGVATISDASGTLSTGSGTQTLTGQDLRLPGVGRAQLTAEQVGDTVVSHEILTGAGGTTVRGVPLVVPQGWIPTPVLWLLALLVVGGVGAALYRWRRPTLSAEECAELANAALAGGRHALALEWIERALKLGPETARLRMEQGDCLAALGEVGPALEAYERAAKLTDDGEPLYMAALLAEGVADGPERVEGLLARALERTPLFALDLEEDFPRLRSRRSFRSLRTRALGRLD